MRVLGVVAAVTRPRSTDDIVAIVFLDIAIVVAVARTAGALFKKIRQPAVVGEIVAGIALGPSLLGLLPGHLPTLFFPSDVRPYLGILAQLGLIIFMFIVGLEVDVALIRGKERVAGVISLSSIALPFGLGILLATALHTSHTNADAPQAHRFLPFALFIGASMSITAFPVLARILTERQMARTEIGSLALACAAVDDVMAWSLLAFVLAIINSSGALSLPRILIESVAFVALMFLAVKPGLERLARRYEGANRLAPNILAVVLIGLLLASYTTERIGIHQIFGAFLFGMVMPRTRTEQFLREILERLEQFATLLLLPLFFVVSGFGVDLRHLGQDAVTQLPFILLVAISGKLLGAAVAARAQGVPGAKAAALGVLMNTRGLTELIILNVGRESGVLDTRLFTMLVVMAVLTTIMTAPLLRRVYPDKMLRRDIADAKKAALGVVDPYRVMVLVGGGGDDARLVDTAADMIGEVAPSELVLTTLGPAWRGPDTGPDPSGELVQMASVLERLEALAHHAQGRKVYSVVHSQFSSDLGDDLVAQAAAVNADIVLVPAPSEDSSALVGRLLRDTPGGLVFAVAPSVRAMPGAPGNSVAVVVSDGPNGAAAVEIGARVAFSRHCDLHLIPERSSRKLARHVAGAAQELARAGLDCLARPRSDRPLEEAVRDATPALVLLAADDSGTIRGQQLAGAVDAVVLVVRASADEDGRGLERWLRQSRTGGS